jgi:MacB-like periplasmic core domain
MISNLRLALRALTKQPFFTAIVIFTFALGIGANTAVFSVLNAVLLRPLAFYQPEKLVELQLYDMRLGPASGEGSSVSYPDFRDWRAQNQVFDRVCVYTNQNLTLTDGNEATYIQAQAVSGELFDLLGVAPFLGRSFNTKEDEPGNRGDVKLRTLAAALRWRSLHHRKKRSRKHGPSGDVIRDSSFCP